MRHVANAHYDRSSGWKDSLAGPVALTGIVICAIGRILTDKNLIYFLNL